MSGKSWLKEFYPEPLGKRRVLVNVQADARHSIKKWEGLRQHNLDKHKVRIKGGNLYDINNVFVLGIDCDSCALCNRHSSYGPDDRRTLDCNSCQLHQLQANCCKANGAYGHIYGAIEDGNPEPMINLLRRLLNE